MTAHRSFLLIQWMALVSTLVVLGTWTLPASAHHGVAGIGAAALQGPGAPIEAATSATLPDGKFLLYFKLDHADYETFDSDSSNPESDYANFWIGGLGYGVTPWFSAYLFVPYNQKEDEPGGVDTSGFADISFFGQIGFKWDEGFRLIPANESLDDFEDWHFTLIGGFTIPTGDENVRDDDGNIDPGKSTGFGSPSYFTGLTATRVIADRWTVNLELSRNAFTKNTYADGNRTRFGTEYRVNPALVYRAYTNPEHKVRLDLSGEPQYLHLGRDRTNGEDERATGGDMIYLLGGLRGYWRNISAAVGAKVPIWKDLNEEDDQQGGEGTENYRFIFTFSVLFP